MSTFCATRPAADLATTLNEIAVQSNCCITLNEQTIPVHPAVNAACEMLGFDPLYVANEGKLVAMVAKEDAERVLAAMRNNRYGEEAVIIGEVTDEPRGRVLLRTTLGTHACLACWRARCCRAFVETRLIHGWSGGRYNRPMPDTFLLYGSYGYTGNLIAELAASQGLRPLLAGRDETRLRAQAERLSLDFRVIDLENTSALDDALRSTGLVVHCAGPFVLTFRQMAEACLRTGAHYMDISGEIEGFEALAALDSQARAAGVMLLPGAGFDVVPSDCLAAHMKGRLPSATHLKLFIRSVGGGISRGTARSGIENMQRGGTHPPRGKHCHRASCLERTGARLRSGSRQDGFHRLGGCLHRLAQHRHPQRGNLHGSSDLPPSTC